MFTVWCLYLNAQYLRWHADSLHLSLFPVVIKTESTLAHRRQTAVTHTGYHRVCACTCACPFVAVVAIKQILTCQQMLHLAVCAFVPSFTHWSLQQKRGLPLLNQVISWITLGRRV